MATQTVAAKRASELRAQIEEANRNYHLLDAPTITDEQYDALLRELVELEDAHPNLVTPDSPTQHVGGAPSPEFAPYRHVVPMLALANAFEEDELRAFDARVTRLAGGSVSYTCGLKIDGLAMSLRYENGSFVSARTRGDGTVGEEVTANVRMISEIPKKLRGAFPPAIDVRGEVYLRKSAFKALNDRRAAAGLTVFANPRNTAAGGLRQKDPRMTAERKLSFFAYAVGAFEGVPLPSTQHALLQALRGYGFPVNDREERCPTIDDVVTFCTRWQAERESLDYEIDGVVIKVDDLVLQAKLGYAGKDPRWAIAFKFRAAEARTKLLAIDINVSRTGKLNPYA